MRFKLTCCALLALLVCPVAAFSTTITAFAVGDADPEPVMYPATLLNGDFLIEANAASVPVVGDGANERTTWTFDFTGDPGFGGFDASMPLDSAILTLTLTPRTTLITTDRVGINAGGLSLITSPVIQSLPVNVTSTVSFDLLDFYTSADVLGVFTTPTLGEIPMLYLDDAVVSYAQLDLTRVPEPVTLHILAIGLSVLWYRRRA